MAILWDLDIGPWCVSRVAARGQRPAEEGAHPMSLRRKIFLLCLALVTALVVIAVSNPGGGAHILQIKYLQPA